jgi:hypothetical protein
MRITMRILIMPLVLTAMLLSVPAHAQKIYGVTPYSWPQFKADFGLPSTPMTLEDSGQTDVNTDNPAPANFPVLANDQQILAYLLGDIGKVLPPAGLNNFLDLEEGTGAVGVDDLEAWVGPFYGDNPGINSTIIVDDDNTQNTESFFNPNNSTTDLFTSGAYENNGAWSLVTNSVGVVPTEPTITAIPPGTGNYYADSYRTIPATDRAAEDSTDGGISPNYSYWVPNVLTPGYYNVYADFPSENLTSTPPEGHVTDARYTVYIKIPGQALAVYTQTVDQDTGGGWEPVGGPYYFPITTGQLNVGPPPTTGNILPLNTALNAGPYAYVCVDDTSANLLTTEINGTNYNNVVVADAIELRPDAGMSFGTPTAINITAPILSSYTVPEGSNPSVVYSPSITTNSELGTTGDYAEVALGYGAGKAAGDGFSGGLPISYVTDSVTVAAAGTPTAASPSPAQFFNGSIGYNPFATSNAASPQPATTLPTLPIDQVTYFTRTESVANDPSNPFVTSQVGFLYCANGQTGDVIWRFPSSTPFVTTTNDPSPAFTSTGFTGGQTANESTSYGGEAYSSALSNPGGGSTATWQLPSTAPAGNYYVYVWFPSESSAEPHIDNAVYTIATGNTTGPYVSEPVDQQNGGTWVKLYQTFNGTTTALYALSAGASVTLSNASLDSPAAYAVADAVEFVPEETMSSTDSSPAVIRNLKVYDSVSKQYLTRTVVVAADNAGKVYCVDAAGNGDGNDILEDADNVPVYINASGQAYENPLGSPVPISAVLPLHPTAYGTTHVYWIWQPDTAAPIGSTDIIDLNKLGTNSFSSVSAVNGTWTATTSPTAYDTVEYDDPAVARTATAPTDYFTYEPDITPVEAGPARVFVWNPGATVGQKHIPDAEYTVVDEFGNTYTCVGVDQTTASPGFVSLEAVGTGQTIFDFAASLPQTPAGFATGRNTVVLDNTTTSGVTGAVVVADAIELSFTAGADANSNLIAPLAFQTCSPTVHTTLLSSTSGTATATPSTATSPSGNNIKYDTYSAKIYIGNTNGVLYALDASGNADGADVFQRDFSDDPSMPSPSVDWWFNVGATSVDSFGEIEDQSGVISQAIAGAPAYYHNPNPPAGVGTTDTNSNAPNAFDEILFSTYSPGTDSSDVGDNQGNLYSVNAQGPIGDYGAGPIPDKEPDYRYAAGTSGYNLSPIPLFSFPDAYGTPHYPNGQALTPTLPVYDHLMTSLVPPANGVVPPANPLGDAAGSPAIFGGITIANPAGGGSIGLPEEAYFTANDPTPDGEMPTEGRVWGVNLTSGTVDKEQTKDQFGNIIRTFVYPYIDPDTLAGEDPGIFDPNIIADGDVTSVTNFFETQDTVNNYNTLQFGPFSTEPVEVANSNLVYEVSSSPAVGIVHTIPASAGTLTDTLIGGDGYSAQYGGNPYDIDVPMLYTGDLFGVLHSINLAGQTDISRFIQDSTLDGSAIISTPALLANGNGPNIGLTTGNNAGGVLFATTESGALWESEAFPFIENNLFSSTGVADPLARNVDFEYGGPGAYSSVASASFNIDNFQALPAGENTQSAGANGAVTAGTTASVDTSEWLYASSDGGWTYGLTPDNTSLGNGLSFNPGGNIPPESVPPDNTIPLNRQFLTGVYTTPQFAPGSASANYVASTNPVFDWGETAYIVIYGLDDPKAGSPGYGLAATPSYPRAITLTFTIAPPGTGGNSNVSAGSTTIDLAGQGVAVPISTAGGAWPPAGYVLTTNPDAATAPSVGDFATEYAFQMAVPNSTQPQTPGSRIWIQNITEQVQYLTNGSDSTPVTATVHARQDPTGTIIREPNSSGTGYTDVPEPGVSQAQFSILNPIGVRGAGQSLGTNAYYNLGLPTEISGSDNFSQLGPFRGIESNDTTYTDFATADANGNSIPLTQPLPPTVLTHPNDPSNSTANNQDSSVSPPVILAVSPGFVSQGTSGNSATVDPAGTDPNADPTQLTPILPSGNVPNDYGQSLLNIADRSDLGGINKTLADLAATPAMLGWNDNSASGNGGLAVINPLPWEVMPKKGGTTGTGSADYPSIGANDSSIEVLPRVSADGFAAQGAGQGSDTVITTGDGTLAPSVLGTGVTDQAQRSIFPNAALVRIQVPPYQPANLESYAASSSSPALYATSSQATRLTSQASNVGQGYIGTFRVFTNIIFNNNTPRKFNPKDAYRMVNVWVSVPADTSTAISEPTIDLGDLPAGFGLDLGNVSSNGDWLPYNIGPNYGQANSILGPFFKPITIVNKGNVNDLNVKLNQYNLLPSQEEPTAFGSFSVSGLSTVPSYDVVGTGATSGIGLLTNTPYLPILRSSIDYYPTLNSMAFDDYNFNQLLTASFANQSTVAAPPGAVAPKAHVGDLNGAVLTVPAVPHNNLGQFSVNLNSQPYSGRSVVSVAVPLGTPAGTYSATVSAFEDADPPTTVYNGPTYGGSFYTDQGWESPSTGAFSSTTGTTAPGLGFALVNGVLTAEQTQSKPSTTVKFTVGPDRFTDGSPLPVTNGVTATVDAVLPQSDGDVPVRANSNDLQPWPYYDPSGLGGNPTFGVLFTSQRNSTAAAPYSLYASALVAANNLLNTPTSSLSNWWTPAKQITEVGGPTGTSTLQQSYDASAYGTLTANSVSSPTNALWVTSDVSSTGSTIYSLNQAQIGYANSGQTLGNATTLFTSTLPIFNPRASYYYGTNSSGQGFSPSSSLANAPAAGTYPLIVYYTKAGGRSTLMYWPAVSTVNGVQTVASAAVPVPAGVVSASTPTIVPRAPVSISGTVSPQIDIVFSGTLGSSSTADIVSARYTLMNSTTYGTAALTLAGTLPTTPYTTATSAGQTVDTTAEPLTAENGNATWQARDIAWYRNGSAGEFALTMQTSAQTAPLVLVPYTSPGVYDRASGQWIFTINWNNLLTLYSGNSTAQATLSTISAWWTGVTVTPPNIIVYANPNLGTVTFSLPLPTNSLIASGTQFQSLAVNVNPGALRTTYLTETNTSPIAFIDNTYKTQDAPITSGFGPALPTTVQTSRYWYIYRKQTTTTGPQSAATSVLYYNTRRLTLLLPYPVQLTYNTNSTTGQYYVTNFDIKDANNNDVTGDVDLDWARGRVYFPETINGVPTEGQNYTVTYTYTVAGFSNTSATITIPNNSYPTYTGQVTWQDEPEVNSPTATASIGEHVVPDNTPTNESDPVAFLDPLAGFGGNNLQLNPSTATPTNLSGQPYAHKVWLFWTSNRNAPTTTVPIQGTAQTLTTGGDGSDIYWETIDPRFEVINP